MISCVSLFQDAMGRDAYLEWAREHWVSGVATVPLAALLLVVSCLAITWNHRKGDQ